MIPESLQKYRERLMPHQAEFIEQFLAPGAAKNLLLVAAPGSGTGSTVISLVHELSERGRLRHVLVLVPGALTQQFADRFRAIAPSVPVSVVRRPEFRELESHTPAGKPLWSEPVVLIMPLDVAKHADVRLGLASTRWELVVVDEAHRLAGQRAEVIGFLLSLDSIGRLLLLTATPPDDGFAALVPGIVRTNWNPREMLNWDGTPLFQPTRLHFLRFTRSPLELEFLRLLDELVKMIPSESKGQFAGEQLVKRAQSNLFSLDPVLLQLQGSLIEAAADPKAASTDEPDEDEPSDLWAQIRWPDQGIAQRLVNRLVELLDTLDKDSKLNALVAAMGDWARTPEEEFLRICIFCEYADTATYVAESLRGRWTAPVFSMTGSTPTDERAASLRALAANSAVLVATDAVLEGVDLSCVDYAVNYDIPWNPLRLEQRRGRVDRIGRKRPLNFLCLDDVTGDNVLARLEQKLNELGLPGVTAE